MKLQDSQIFYFAYYISSKMYIPSLAPNMKDAIVKFGCHLAGDKGNPGPLDSLPSSHLIQAITTNTVT